MLPVYVCMRVHMCAVTYTVVYILSAATSMHYSVCACTCVLSHTL